MLKQILKKYLPARFWRFLGRKKKHFIAWFLETKLAFFERGKNKIIHKFMELIFSEKFLPIKWIDEVAPIKTLQKSFSDYSYSPKYQGNQNKVKVDIPDINLYKFFKVNLHVESSHLVSEEFVYMERLPLVSLKNCNYSTGIVKCHSDSNAIIYNKDRKKIKVRKGFFLGGNGSWNYYHLTFEILSKLKYLDYIDDDSVIILPEAVKNNKNYQSLLNILLAGSRKEVFYVEKKRTVEVDELYHITPPSNIVFNLRENSDFLTDYVYFDMTSIDYIRNKLLSISNKVDEDFLVYKRIFLARKPGAARSYNQEDVSQVLKNYGFEEVYLEDFSIIEQVRIFNNADYIVGPSGAAWTNLIFTNPGTKSISWLADNISEFSAFSTLAAYFQSDMSFIKCKPDDHNELHTGYMLNCKELEAIIINNLDISQ